MPGSLNADQTATVATLLKVGKTVKEICKFVDLPVKQVTGIARSLDLTPDSKTKKRAKQLYGSQDGLTYADIAQTLQKEKMSNEGEPIHYLTVATWVANHGWSWGGSDDGDYKPDRKAGAASRSKYTLRMSKRLMAEVNSNAALNQAAASAWQELREDRTNVVAVAVVRGAAAAGCTDIAEVKTRLLDRHGEAIRAARS